MVPRLFLLGLLLGCQSLWAAPAVKVLQLPSSAGEAGDVLVDASGTVHAVWEKGGQLWYATSTDDGRVFSPPMQASLGKEGAFGGMHRGAQLSLGRDGTIHVIWYPNMSKIDRSDWGIRYAKLPAGAAKFTDAVNLGKKPSDNYSVAADGKGQVVAMWTADGVYVARSSNDGDSFDPPQKVGDLDPCECCATAPAFDANGKLALLYRDKRQNDRDMYIAPDVLNFPAQKTQLNPGHWKIKSCPMSGTSLVMLAKGGFAAGWEDKGNVFVSLAPSATGPIKSVLLGKGRYPKVLGLPDGSVFAAWKEGNTIVWKAFDITGKELAGGRAGTTPFRARFGAAVSRKGDILISP